MTAKKDVLEIWKERIANESVYGDISKACKNASVSITTHTTALKKQTLIDLSPAELKALQAHIAVLDERKEMRKKIQEEHATR